MDSLLSDSLNTQILCVVIGYQVALRSFDPPSFRVGCVGNIRTCQKDKKPQFRN